MMFAQEWSNISALLSILVGENRNLTRETDQKRM